MAITKDFERQYVLSAEVEIDYTQLVTGVAQEAIDIPQNAVVIGGEWIVDTVWDSGTSDVLDIGDGGDVNRYIAADDLTAAGRNVLLLTGFKYTAADTIDAEWTGTGAVPSQGAGRLLVQYVKTGRGNENYR